ncbi:hypothetical protein [Saccharicrinis aurantiacus]|uniref:hypothetical protein n=1 Tax=Saccharicrinis aurantiacus TaxID=1849719 RepID=UPI00094F67BC|nr:hypothetical protein [Saccharicrinis aurantiacus]
MKNVKFYDVLKRVFNLVSIFIVCCLLFSACTKDDSLLEEADEIFDELQSEDNKEKDDESTNDESDNSEEEEDSEVEQNDENDSEEENLDEGEHQEEETDDSTDSEEQEVEEETSVDVSDAIGVNNTYDVVYKITDKIYFDIEDVDLSGISKIKVVGINGNMYIGLLSKEKHSKYILMDMSATKAKVTVGGINNTIEVLGLEPSNCRKLILFSVMPKTSSIYKKNGKVYVEIIPINDSENYGSRVLVYIGEESKMSDAEIKTQQDRIMKDNIETDSW